MTEDELDAIHTTKEPLIETRAGGRVYRTVIWAVVADGKVYVRSFLGDDGKWYQRALADPAVALVIGDVRIPFRAVRADDEASVAAASAGLRAKYRGRSLDSMVRPEVLHTTLWLEPTT